MEKWKEDMHVYVLGWQRAWKHCAEDRRIVVLNRGRERERDRKNERDGRRWRCEGQKRVPEIERVKVERDSRETAVTVHLSFTEPPQTHRNKPARKYHTLTTNNDRISVKLINIAYVTSNNKWNKKYIQTEVVRKKFIQNMRIERSLTFSNWIF